MKFLFEIASLLIFTLFSLFLSTADSAGQTEETNEYEQKESAGAIITSGPVSDGPYVCRQHDLANIVFYICDDFFESRNFQQSDTLKFRGFCHDTDMVYLIPSEPEAIEPEIIENVSKILAVSDIHGNYGKLTDILKKSGVIDEGRHWIWGNGHLVIVGDIFDRGDKVTECLWLIYMLEQEARRAGGDVHFILGNHELMVMQGDNRYVNDKYINGIVRVTAIKHEDLYGTRMSLGRWLRSKNTVMKINNILFVHGGIAPSLLDHGLDLKDINRAVRACVDLPDSLSVNNELAGNLFGSKGPFWYRGYFNEMEGRYSRATTEEIDDILNYFNAEKIVVGHSSIDQISGLYENRIFGIHVPLEAPMLQALLWQDGKFYRVTGRGERELLD